MDRENCYQEKSAKEDVYCIDKGLVVDVWLGLLNYFVCYILNTSEIIQHMSFSI